MESDWEGGAAESSRGWGSAPSSVVADSDMESIAGDSVMDGCSEAGECSEHSGASDSEFGDGVEFGDGDRDGDGAGGDEDDDDDLMVDALAAQMVSEG